MSWVEWDQQYIWHPFTQMKTAIDPTPIVRAEGVYVYDHQGRAYVDAISSWWVNLHGHCHPHIIQAVNEQISRLDHVIFAGYTHEKAAELAKRLLEILPLNQSKIFFSDNGSTAVEVGLKMSIQYHYNRQIEKKRIITCTGGYHGDTFGGMSVGSRSKFSLPFSSKLFDVDFIPYPKPGCEEESVRTLNEILRKDDCAAFVYEPLVQGVSGFSMAAAKAFDPLLALCRSYDVISIADEVMTGFGRTGSLFASEQMEHAPDIMCLSKGITGGVLPLAVTSCSDRIYQAFWDDSKEKAFLHGHSYAANAVACAAACASLDLLLSEESRSQRKDIERCFDKVKDRFNGHPKLAEVRHKGCLIAFEIKDNSPGYFSSYATRLQKFYRDNWVLLRPLGNVIYMIPPYCINSDQIDMVSEVIWNSLELIDG